MTIKVVFFDIGNVLLRFDSRAVAAKIAWAVRRSPVAIARYLWTNESVVEKIESGKLSPRDIYERFRRELGYAGTYAAFCRLWCDHFTLDRAVAGLLRRLRRTRRIYLLSNTNDLHYTFIRKHYAFTRHAHGAVLSHEIGLRKPDPAIYRHALQVARAAPEECLFIDDLKVNVDAARKLGVNVIHHTDAPALRAALVKLGLL